MGDEEDGEMATLEDDRSGAKESGFDSAVEIDFLMQTSREV